MARYGETVLHAGDDNLLLAVGAAIEKLIPPTPPPPAPTCSGCSAIAGRAQSNKADLTSHMHGPSAVDE